MIASVCSITDSEVRSGTFSRSASYIFLFWKADLRTIRRKVDLSIAHRVPPAVTACNNTKAICIKIIGTKSKHTSYKSLLRRGALLKSDLDGGSARHVVHKRQLAEAAVPVVGANLLAAHEDVVFAAEMGETQSNVPR